MTAHPPAPRTSIDRRVTPLHNQHHFSDFSRWFHVSPGGEVINRAFGSVRGHEALGQQQRAEFLRTLGLRPTIRT